MITKTIDNFTGALTRKNTGDMNSGLAKYETSFGYDPFSKPGDLTWMEQPTSVKTNGGALIQAGKTRMESGTNYFYCIDDEGRMQKIMVNNTTTKNPNADSVVGALVTNTSYLAGSSIASWVKGGSLEFFGTTEKIYLGHDQGISRINFDFSAPTYVGSYSSITASVPRPLVKFLGKLYFANGTNIGEIDSTETITSYAKLSPGFPIGTYIRDLDVTPDGNYLQITVSQINGPQLAASNLQSDTTVLASSDSYKFYWNGVDTSYTAFDTYYGFTLVSNKTFGQFNYTMGYDLGGAALYSGTEKRVTLPNFVAPNFNANFSTGNLLGFAAPEYDNADGRLEGAVMFYGQYDEDVPKGLYRLLKLNPATGTDVQIIPMCTTISNLEYGSSQDGYTGNIFGTAKLYFSAYDREGLASGTSRLFKFTTVPTGLGSTIGGVWESQNEIFSKKTRPAELRFYTEPLVANNSFNIAFVDATSSVLGSKTFTVGTAPVVSGTDKVWWNPNLSPAHNWGVRVTNLGTKNWVGIKMEIDFVEAGK